MGLLRKNSFWKVLFSTLKFEPKPTRKKRFRAVRLVRERVTISQTEPLLGWTSAEHEVHHSHERSARRSTLTEPKKEWLLRARECCR